MSKTLAFATKWVIRLDLLPDSTMKEMLCSLLEGSNGNKRDLFVLVVVSLWYCI